MLDGCPSRRVGERSRSPSLRGERGSEREMNRRRGQRAASPSTKREHSRARSEDPHVRGRTDYRTERRRHASWDRHRRADDREYEEPRNPHAWRGKEPVFIKLDGKPINVQGDVRASIDRIFNKQINDCKSASELCDLVGLGKNLQNLNAIHTSNCIDTLGKRLSEQASDRVKHGKLEEAVNGLAEHLIDIMRTPEFADNVRALASSLHGLALIHIAGAVQVSRNTALKLAIAEHVEAVLNHMRPWELTQTIWSFAKLGWCTTDVQALLAGIEARCCDMLDEVSRARDDRQDLTGFDRFDGVAIPNILQALPLVDPAHCEWKPSEGFLHRLEIHAAEEAWNLNRQGVVTVVTGLAKLDRDPPAAVKAQICLRAMKLMSDAGSQDVSNIFWGMAKMGWQPPAPLLDILFQRMKALRYEFNRQEIVNMWWSTAMMNVRLGPGQEYWEGMMDRMCHVAFDFNAQDMSMFFYALSCMGYSMEAIGRPRLQPFFDRLETAVLCSSPPSIPQNVVQIFRAFAHLQIPCEMLQQHISVLSQRSLVLIDRFNGQDLSGLFWSFATLMQRPGEELMRRMARRLVNIQNDLNAQDVSLICWALRTGAWHLPDGEALDVPDGNLDAACTPAPAIGQHKHTNGEVYDPTVALGVLHERSMRIIDQFLPRDFANIFWAVSGLGVSNRRMGWPERPDFFMFLCDGLDQQLHDQKLRSAHLRTGRFDARDLAQILHSIAVHAPYMDRAGCWQRFEQLLHALSHACAELIPSFCPQDLENVAFACAQLKWNADGDTNARLKERLLAPLLQRARDLMPQLNEQHLASLVGALSNAKYEDRDFSVETISEFMAECSRQAADLVVEITCAQEDTSRRLQAIVKFAWGLGKLQVRQQPELRDRFLTLITANVDSLQSNRLSVILWASATAPQHTVAGSSAEQAEKALLRSVLTRLKANAEEEEPELCDVAVVLWSLVSMSSGQDFRALDICTAFRELVNCYAPLLERGFKDLQSQACDSKTSLANVSPVTSFACDTSLDTPALLGRSDLCMLHQFFLSCVIDDVFATAVGDATCPMHQVRAQFSEVCKEAFVQANLKTTKSDLHMRVCNVLKHGLELDVEDEFRCEQSGYTIDLKVTRTNPHQVWCVEVNGPSHYLLGAQREAGDSRVGATRLKMHHLTLLGYTVVMVPYWEWDKIDYRLEARQEDQIAFLQKVLRLECASGPARTGHSCTVRADAPIPCPGACSHESVLEAAEQSLAETPGSRSESQGSASGEPGTQTLSRGRGGIVV